MSVQQLAEGCCHQRLESLIDEMHEHVVLLSLGLHWKHIMKVHFGEALQALACCLNCHCTVIVLMG